MRDWPAAVIALFVLGSVGCDSGGYDVEIRFDPEALADDAQGVEVALGAPCADQTLGEPPVGAVASAVARRSGGSMALGDLEPGDYGLVALARDGGCAVMAAGCADVSIEAGGSGTLAVTLEAATGPGCAAGRTCDDGVCSAPGDAGPPGDCPGGCDDGDDCTDEICAASGCVYTTRDADMDGHGDDSCPEVGGVPADDCDDASADAYLGASELCNAADDDCDDATDEDFDCVLGSTVPCQACGDGARTCEAGTCTLGACAPAADPDLVASWMFDAEPATDAFSDATGSHPGMVVGGEAMWEEGPFGCGDAFGTDGMVPYGEVPHSPDFDLSAGSLRAWVRFDADLLSQGVWSRDANGTTFPGHLTLSRDAMDVVNARIQNVAGEITRCTTGAVTGGQWHEVIVRWGPPDFELVVDGIIAEDALCDVGVNASGIVGNMNPWVIGARSSSSEEGMATPITAPLDGAIAHVELRSGRADPAAPEVTGFVLVDAATDTDIGALGDGAVIDSATYPSISIRATTDPYVIDHLVYDIDGVMDAHVENLPPYAIAGGTAPAYTAWAVEPGEHTITARAFSTPMIEGPPRTITITVQ